MKRWKKISMLLAAACFAWPLSSRSVELPQSKTFSGRILVGTAVDQDKAPCLTETLYFRQGDDAFRLVLAYPTNFVRARDAGTMPLWEGHFAGRSNELLELPQGMGIVMAKTSSVDTRRSPGARLVLLEKLKPGPTTPAIRRSDPPGIRIIEPVETVISQPHIQIKGISDKPLSSVRFDLLNDRGRVLDQPAFVTESHFDTHLWKFTTNWFECVDVELAPGTNLVRLTCEDTDGHRVRSTHPFVLRFDQDKTAPRMAVHWPRLDCELSGENFTARGQLDDPSAKVLGKISAAGRTVAIEGIVERQGRFWVERIPLLARSNLLSLTVTDAAGNSSTTNLLVIKSESSLTVDPVPNDQLWQLQVTVTGKVSPSQQRVWVNGRPAKVNPNGSWVASGVALNNEGVAIFEAIASPDPAAAPSSVPSSPNLVAPVESAIVEGSLTSQPLILNISQPAYGKIEIHLDGTAGRDFVLAASTNLIDWTPILTNRNSGPTFHYTDTNAVQYGCRFFRVLRLE